MNVYLFSCSTVKIWTWYELRHGLNWRIEYSFWHPFLGFSFWKPFIGFDLSVVILFIRGYVTLVWAERCCFWFLAWHPGSERAETDQKCCRWTGSLARADDERAQLCSMKVCRWVQNQPMIVFLFVFFWCVCVMPDFYTSPVRPVSVWITSLLPQLLWTQKSILNGGSLCNLCKETSNVGAPFFHTSVYDAISTHGPSMLQQVCSGTLACQLSIDAANTCLTDGF